MGDKKESQQGEQTKQGEETTQQGKLAEQGDTAAKVLGAVFDVVDNLL